MMVIMIVVVVWVVGIYKRKVEPVLVLLSDSYSKGEILIYDSRPSFCPAYTFY